MGFLDQAKGTASSSSASAQGIGRPERPLTGTSAEQAVRTLGLDVATRLRAAGVTSEGIGSSRNLGWRLYMVITERETRGSVRGGVAYTSNISARIEEIWLGVNGQILYLIREREEVIRAASERNELMSGPHSASDYHLHYPELEWRYARKQSNVEGWTGHIPAAYDARCTGLRSALRGLQARADRPKPARPVVPRPPASPRPHPSPPVTGCDATQKVVNCIAPLIPVLGGMSLVYLYKRSGNTEGNVPNFWPIVLSVTAVPAILTGMVNDLGIWAMIGIFVVFWTLMAGGVLLGAHVLHVDISQ